MRSIVMTAGCSGCGTAAVTAAVARQLALQGKKVLLVEATAGLRRMNRLLEIREEGLFDFSDLLEGRCALENALLPTRIAGLTLLQGPSAIDWVPEAADVQLLREELSGTEQYDALLWYCPPGAGPLQKGLLPAAETPAHTEGYEGFFHLCEMSGDESSAEAAYIIRDHDREKFETRKVLMQQTADFMNQKYGAGTFTLHMTDSYYNMKEKLTDHMYLIHNAEAAMQKAGVTPKIVAIRGGTDGARLSYEGLPCPNLSTGGLNFHSIHEFIPVRSLEKMVEVLRNLVTL